MRVMLLQVLYSVRSERQILEQISYNLLFRWFVGEDEECMPYSEWTRYLKEFGPQCTSQPPPPGLYAATDNAVAVDGWGSIQAAQLAEFRERGLLVVGNAFTPNQLADAIEGITQLLSGSMPGYKPGRWGQKNGVLLRAGRDLDSIASEQLDSLVLARALVDYDPRLKAIALHPELTKFLRQVMGDDPVLIHNMVRAKPPSEGDKPWHQDLTHFSLHPSATVVTAWIAIDDAPLEAGCLHFVPGTHRFGPAKHVFGRDYQIPDSDVARTGQVAAPVKKGSCVVFNALLHHGSPANHSNNRRLALQLTFKPANARGISDEERILTFSGSGRGWQF